MSNSDGQGDPATPKTIYLYDKWNHPVFQIEIDDPGKYREVSMNATVYEITSWSADDKNDPIDRELYIKCYIKWDSCSHFYFGDLDKEDNQDGYLHLCGARYYQQHADLMNYLYYLAFQEMKREPYDDDEVWPLNLSVLSSGATEESPTPSSSTSLGGI